jgi:hypothetical protein
MIVVISSIKNLLIVSVTLFEYIVYACIGMVWLVYIVRVYMASLYFVAIIRVYKYPFQTGLIFWWYIRISTANIREVL